MFPPWLGNLVLLGLAFPFLDLLGLHAVKLAGRDDLGYSKPVGAGITFGHVVSGERLQPIPLGEDVDAPDVRAGCWCCLGHGLASLLQPSEATRSKNGAGGG